MANIKTGKADKKKPEAGSVKPWDQVEFKWTKPSFGQPATTMLHSALAKKMEAAGKGKIVKDGERDVRDNKDTLL